MTRIFSICCVRDERDVIGETLHAALAWSDRIFVLDNGSTDGTWEMLLELSSNDSRITLVDREFGPFSEELRAGVFDAHRDRASEGDWWCRLDADEFYIDNPRDFLARVPRRFGFVRSATFNFYLTDKDVEAYDADPEGWAMRPVQERLRYYQNNWSEGRFVRHRDDLDWTGQIWPRNRGRVYRDRIRLKHFQYRSPAQIEQRLRIRQQRLDIFPHEAGRSLAVPDRDSSDWVSAWMRQARFEEASWRDRVRPAADCDLDRGDGNFRLREDLMPALPPRFVDGARATVQTTRLGNALIKPVLSWRHRRRGVRGARDSLGRR